MGDRVIVTGSKIRSKLYVFKCSACGESVSVDPSKGLDLTIEHESDCPFSLAIEEGPNAAAAWIVSNGYPMTLEPAT